MWQRLKNKIFPRYEYVYFCVVNSKVFSNFGQKKLFVEIDKDLRKHKKKLVDIDFYTDQSFDSVIVMATAVIKHTIHLIPIMYEIYAYLKKGKDVSVITYKNQELKLVFDTEEGQKQELTIYKYKIKC